MEYLGTKATGSDLADQADITNLTTKGDLEAYSTVATRLAVGTNGQVLTADSAEATGLKWAASAASPTLSKGITIIDPANAADTLGAFFTPVAITVTDVRSYRTAGTNVVFNIGHAATRTGTQLDVFTSDITLTSTAGQSNATGFSDATIPANSWVWLEIISVSGAVENFHATIVYTED